MTWTGWRTTESGRVGTVRRHTGHTMPPSVSVQLTRSCHPDARQVAASSPEPEGAAHAAARLEEVTHDGDPPRRAVRLGEQHGPA